MTRAGIFRVVPVGSGLQARAKGRTGSHPDGMRANNAMSTRGPCPRARLCRTPWLVALVMLAASMAGCSGSEAPPRDGTLGPASPTRGSDRPMSQHRLDKLTGFLDKVEFLDQVGPEFELRDVEYTSSTDAVAYFVNIRPVREDLGSVIATTDDNWAHSSRIRISEDLADLVDYFPLGRGAVAIKAQDQFPRRSYPPFVLYPDGQVEPLRVVQPRVLDADSELPRDRCLQRVPQLAGKPGRQRHDGCEGPRSVGSRCGSRSDLPGRRFTTRRRPTAHSGSRRLGDERRRLQARHR